MQVADSINEFLENKYLNKEIYFMESNRITHGIVTGITKDYLLSINIRIIDINARIFFTKEELIDFLVKNDINLNR